MIWLLDCLQLNAEVAGHSTRFFGAPIFSAPAAPDKHPADASGRWWLRSPHFRLANLFVRVTLLAAIGDLMSSMLSLSSQHLLVLRRFQEARGGSQLAMIGRS